MSPFRMIPLTVLAIGLIGAAPTDSSAQVRIVIEGRWDWGSDEPRYDHRPGAYYPTYPLRAVKIPPGHLPPPGRCRVWYPGRPPGHQPPPVSCRSLGYVYPGAIVIDASGSPWVPYYGEVLYEGGRGYGGNHYSDYRDYDDWWDEDRYDDYDRYKENPRGRGGGRRGRR